MKTETFETQLRYYIKCGMSLISVETYEKKRCIRQIEKVVKDINEKQEEGEDYNVAMWSIAQGWTQTDGTSIDSGGPVETAHQAIEQIDHLNIPEFAVFIMKDFGLYFHKENNQYFDLVISQVTEFVLELQKTGRIIIFVGSGFKSPDVLSHEIKHMDYSFPDEEQIEKSIRFIFDQVNKKPDEEYLPRFVDSAKGMTEQEVQDNTALIVTKFRAINDEAITQMWREKIQIIENTDLLKYDTPPEGGLDNIGGLENIKQHLALDKACFGQDARDFGITAPKGLLIVGIPGTGKSLTAKCAASYFNLPLITLEIGQLMSKYVGESEANALQAIKLLDSLAPLVLWIDEIEKAFGGVGGGFDSGATQRVFGIFLKWMNDRTSMIYSIMTANNVAALPPEFLRKGRVDEIYWVDLPNDNERKEIIEIHLRKRGRDPSDYDCQDYVFFTEGFSGADIECGIELALKKAFLLPKNKMLTKQILVESFQQIRPISESNKEIVATTREWGNNHAKPANITQKKQPRKRPMRKISIDPSLN